MRVQNPTRRGEIKEAKKVVRPIHQLPRLTASRTYFLASPRTRHVGGGVALCWFYEALKNRPRVRSSPPSSSRPHHVPFPSSSRPRLRTFCRVAITRQSPLGP